MTGDLLGGVVRREPRRWLPVAGAGAVALGLSSLAARHGTVGPAEEAAFDAVNSLPDALFRPMYVLQLPGVLVVGPLVAVGAVTRGRHRLAAAALAATAGKLVAERVLKAAVTRERPYTSIGPGVRTRGDVPHHGQSFTSGHAILTTSLAVVVMPWLPGRWRWVPWALVGGNGVARIYVGAHNPLDVIGGVGIGLMVGAVVDLALGTPAA
jgi:undecaprenyl-diphosphatase